MTAAKQKDLKYICPKDRKQYTRADCEANCDDFLDCPYFTPDEDSQPQQQKTMIDAIAAQPKTDDVERQYAVLELLQFIRSEEKSGPRWRRTTTDGIKIARDFTANNPGGRFWAKKGDEFLSDEAIRQLPAVMRFYELRDSSKPLPAAILLGSIAGKSGSGKAILVEIDDEYEPEKKIWFGLGAVKRNTPGTQGHNPKLADGERYIPSGFTKKTDKSEAKLAIPRPIVLADYEKALTNASVAQSLFIDQGKDRRTPLR